ncbi:putative phage integrase [uncultured Eubacteriales bacterium]|uniref:Putative phage integrase n=1 Tax=uncultured Eubacteriales bacterium TaxID=172733 RepID=A0A212K371_9FIRM|nr:putative phage integrase [uncultured Eubacteriales bacterium]
MTVREWVVYWQEVYDKPKSRPTTYAAHDYVLKNHILPGLGDVKLAELTEPVVSAFLENRKHFGSHRPESSNYPGLGDDTMRHIHRLLQQCLDQAMKNGKMEENPARAFYYAKPKAAKANILSALEIEDYLDAAARLDYLPMFTLALTAGLRQGELIALKWPDLNVEERTLAIHEGRAVERRELVDYAGGVRTISLSPQTVQLLEQEHTKHPSSPYMFPHPGTLRPYSPNMARLLHKRVTEQAGLDHVRFVDLRHTCAALALQGGMEIGELAKMLGHSRIYMTRQNYAPYLPWKSRKKAKVPAVEVPSEALAKASDQLGGLLKL